MKNERLPGLIRPYSGELNIIAKCLDAFSIIGSLWVLCLFFNKLWADYALAAIVAFLLFLFIAEMAEMYRSWRSQTVVQEIIPVFFIWSVVIFTLVFLAYLSKTSTEYSRLTMGSWMVFAPILLCSWRATVRNFLQYIRARGHNSRKVAIAGANASGSHVANLIGSAPWMGLNLIGMFDDRNDNAERLEWDGPVAGDFDNLLTMVHKRNVDVVYITLPMKASERIDSLLHELADTTASVYVVPEPLWLNLMNSRLTNLGHLPAISVFETPFFGLNGWLKRLQDIILSILILVAISIPMLIIAIGIKLTSPGPVFFKQKRYGLGGEEINVWKFRSMRVCENGASVRQAQRQDPRITRFGALLRRTSLDELPQFFNVLQGNMSIVGPRPHAVTHNEQYRALIKGYMLRHQVKPGITGWAQINGWRGETDTIDKMEKRIQHDLWYIRNWSFWLDLRIILMTFFKGFVNKNAY